MGTRGALGFRFRGRDKVTYNHFDSYPTELGIDVMKVIQRFNDEQLAGAAERIVLVQEDELAGIDEIVRYRAYFNDHVSKQTPTEWYSLLRGAQGRLDLYVDGTIDHMIDSHDFLANSLFCEWAYIVNLDTRKLEVHVGFNQDPSADGRYASASGIVSAAGNDYAGVRLLEELPFDVIRAFDEGMDDLSLTAERLELKEQNE